MVRGRRECVGIFHTDFHTSKNNAIVVYQVPSRVEEGGPELYFHTQTNNQIMVLRLQLMFFRELVGKPTHPIKRRCFQLKLANLRSEPSRSEPGTFLLYSVACSSVLRTWNWFLLGRTICDNFRAQVLQSHRLHASSSVVDLWLASQLASKISFRHDFDFDATASWIRLRNLSCGTESSADTSSQPRRIPVH